MLDHQTRRIAGLIAFGVCLYVTLSHLDVVGMVLANFADVFFSVLAGLVMAFVLNVPVSGMERLLGGALDRLPAGARRPSGKAVLGVSIVVVLLAITAVGVLAATMAGPQLVDSAKSIYPLLLERLPQIEAMLESQGIDLSWLAGALQLQGSAGGADVQGLMGVGIGPVVSSLFSAVRTTASHTLGIIFALIIAIYVLAGKRELGRSANRLMEAFLPESWTHRIRHLASLTFDTYSRFLSGQCIEACILGMLIFVAFSVFGLPFAGLIGFLTAIMALIPYLGAFVSCAIGAFLTLLAAPESVILCIVVYISVQFIENQFIYPHVVGSSVGLPALWTLVAALVGGNLFGVIGIIFFIPLVAVLFELMDEQVDRRIAERGVE